MGRKSCRRFGEKTEEKERGHGGTGEGLELPGAAEQLRDHPPLSGRPAAGFPPEGTASRHLLPCVALARSSEPPRTKTTGML